MARFIVRVVLHGAKEDGDAYEDLHQKMENKAYYRFIQGDDGVNYHLPPATYQASGASWSKATILTEVKKIVDETGFKNSILVTESNGSTWRGLAVW